MTEKASSGVERPRTMIDVLLGAMMQAYRETGETQFDKLELHKAIEAHVGYKWSDKRLTNAVQSCRMRGLVDAVGKYTDGRAHGKFWTSMQIMEAETQPESKPVEPVEPVETETPQIEPVSDDAPTETAQEPIKKIPTIHLNPASGNPASLAVCIEGFKSLGIEAVIDDVPDADESAEDAESVVTTPTHQGSKRKRKNGGRVENSPSPNAGNVERAIHLIMQQLGDLSKSVAEVRRITSNLDGVIRQQGEAIGQHGDDLEALDESLGNAIKGFLTEAKELSDRNVSTFRDGYATGWNDCAKTVREHGIPKQIKSDDVHAEKGREQNGTAYTVDFEIAGGDLIESHSQKTTTDQLQSIIESVFDVAPAAEGKDSLPPLLRSKSVANLLSAQYDLDGKFIDPSVRMPTVTSTNEAFNATVNMVVNAMNEEIEHGRFMNHWTYTKSQMSARSMDQFSEDMLGSLISHFKFETGTYDVPHRKMRAAVIEMVKGFEVWQLSPDIGKVSMLTNKKDLIGNLKTDEFLIIHDPDRSRKRDRVIYMGS